ncbi:hypothetical protein [Pectobacterium cacticida]|uniref:hypothetical protein n=1 Tax=Pectobacterium cacticida TaxID=69221 RepID=UPI003986907E
MIMILKFLIKGEVVMIFYGFITLAGICLTIITVCLVVITGRMSGSSEDADKHIKIRRSSYLDGPSSGIF